MKTLSLTVAVLIAAAPAAAQGPIALPEFDEIELQGGGEVTIRHGAAQRVTMVRGDGTMTRFTVEDGRLEIDACIRRCRDYDLEIEIVTPDVDALAIRGGGSIRAEGAFPDRDDLAVAVTGGGAIDIRPIHVREVAAAITGGGTIRTRARDNLAVSINGGGLVTYWGDPATSVAINGGGMVRRGAD